jgi:hypothetical protein
MLPIDDTTLVYGSSNAGSKQRSVKVRDASCHLWWVFVSVMHLMCLLVCGIVYWVVGDVCVSLWLAHAVDWWLPYSSVSFVGCRAL